jgi:uncharacterized protein (DUF1501 family)
MSDENRASKHCQACDEYENLSRRQFLGWSAAATAAAAAAPAWLPRVTFASSFVSGRDVIVSVYLRGGADGLTLVPPYGDPLYSTIRPTLAIAPPGTANGAVDLNGFFGLAPAMAPLLTPYVNGHMLVVHATGLVDGTRSHFDAQRFMELGKARDPFLATGWLGRHIATAPPFDAGAAARAIGIAFQLQTTLAGAPKSVPVPDLATYTITGSSSSRTARLTALNDMHNLVPEPLKAAANNTRATINALAGVNAGAYTPIAGVTYPNTSFGKALRQTAALIKADIGVEAVAIDRGNWDTHSNQGNLANGTMAQNMTDLAGGLRAFYDDVIIGGTANGFPVTVVVMSEFGRTSIENASFGTDHGYANAMFAMGRKIVGGQVLSQWPSLAPTPQNRDLLVTIDHRDILAEIVTKRLGNPNVAAIFPDYTPINRNIAMVG